MNAAGEVLEFGAGVPLSEQGPAPTRVVAGFGFWLFLLSDIILFSALFAAQPLTALQPLKGRLLAFCHGIVSLLFELARLVLSWRSRQQALRRDSSLAFFKVSSPPTMDRDNRSQT